jgi:hypothetical protein
MVTDLLTFWPFFALCFSFLENFTLRNNDLRSNKGGYTQVGQFPCQSISPIFCGLESNMQQSFEVCKLVLGNSSANRLGQVPTVALHGSCCCLHPSFCCSSAVADVPVAVGEPAFAVDPTVTRVPAAATDFAAFGIRLLLSSNCCTIGVLFSFVYQLPNVEQDLSAVYGYPNGVITA